LHHVICRGIERRPVFRDDDDRLEASELFDVPVKAITSGGKQPDRVKARSLAAFWAVKELGMNGTTVGRKIGLSQSAVSRAVHRGEQLSEELAVSLEKEPDI